MLLQRGVAAARSGRTTEALQLLHRVVQVDPGNEMAWLWLSGLMTTNGHKRACLERVLRANPENVYARASLVRLQDTPQTDTGALEKCLGLTPSDYALTP
jgi:thioredoxin-like negative regulator of GroEL